MARPGKVGQGRARRGVAWQGKDLESPYGTARHGAVRHGLAMRGAVRHGMAGIL